MMKKKAEVNTYIRIGFRKDARLPAIYWADRKPGFRSRSFTVSKNFPSKWVMSLKKCVTRCHTVSFGSRFSCPQTWQYRPTRSVLQLRHIFSFLSFKCDTGGILK